VVGLEIVVGEFVLEEGFGFGVTGASGPAGTDGDKAGCVFQSALAVEEARRRGGLGSGLGSGDSVVCGLCGESGGEGGEENGERESVSEAGTE